MSIGPASSRLPSAVAEGEKEGRVQAVNEGSQVETELEATSKAVDARTAAKNKDRMAIRSFILADLESFVDSGICARS